MLRVCSYWSGGIIKDFIPKLQTQTASENRHTSCDAMHSTEIDKGTEEKAQGFEGR